MRTKKRMTMNQVMKPHSMNEHARCLVNECTYAPVHRLTMNVHACVRFFLYYLCYASVGISQPNRQQKEVLIKLGILKRAEILSKNMLFSKKADMYFRVKRLIDDKEMGNLFKVIFVSNKKNKFNLGF